MAWASSSTSLNSSGSRSAKSRKSRPCNGLSFTGALMIAEDRLKTRFYKLSGHDRRDRRVAHRVELRQSSSEVGVVSKSQDQVSARSRLQAEMRGLEPDRRLIL